jgi:hypothetical protein
MRAFLAGYRAQPNSSDNDKHRARVAHLYARSCILRDACILCARYAGKEGARRIVPPFDHELLAWACMAFMASITRLTPAGTREFKGENNVANPQHAWQHRFRIPA